jgi:Transposase and inactivated derivatives
VQALVEEKRGSVKMICETVGLPRSSYYYRSQRGEEGQLEADLETVAGQYPKYGTRRITHQLRRAPYRYQINRKRVQRIMRQKKLLRPVKRARYRTTDSQHPYPRYSNLVAELEITKPEQVWVCDITYVRLGQGFVFLAVVMDVFTRAIRGWNLSRSLDVDLTLVALQMALSVCIPQIHHSDQGVQYAAQAYTDLLKQHGIQISMTTQGKPEENGYAERLMRTIKEEEVDLSEYLELDDAGRQIGCFIEDVYMTKRIHSALGYLTPTEFEAAWRLAHSEQLPPKTP